MPNDVVTRPVVINYDGYQPWLREQGLDNGDLIVDPVVLSIDPGGTTGWSLMSVHADALSIPDVKILANIEHWTHGQITTEATRDGERKCVAAIMQIVAHWPGALVVIEDFILRKFLKGRELLSPVRITAALEYALMEAGHDNFVIQDQGALVTANDERMKSWGLYQRAGGQVHARDADRHSITMLRKLKSGPGLRGRHFPHLYNVRGESKR